MSDYSSTFLQNLKLACDADFVEPHFRTHLERLYGIRPRAGGISAERVFPWRNSSFVVQYRVRLDTDTPAETRDPVWCGHLLPARTDFPDWAGSDSSRGFAIESIGLAIPAFPFDPELPHIADFWRSGFTRSYLRHRAGIEIPSDVARPPAVLAYRLGRRCTLCVEWAPPDIETRAPETGLILKLARQKSLPHIKNALEILRSLDPGEDSWGNLSIPRVHYTDPERGIAVMEVAPGATLHDLTAMGAFEEAAECAGRLLARLHGLSPDVQRRMDIGAELQNLEDWMHLLITVEPALAETAHEAMKQLRMGADVTYHGVEPSLTHGDFFDKQVMYTPGRTTLLDWDGLVAGDPARDYGNFMAHLELRALQQPRDAERIDRGKRTFRAGYANGDTAFEARAGWWTAVSRLRLAALYSLRPRWRHLAPALLEGTRPRAHRATG